MTGVFDYNVKLIVDMSLRGVKAERLERRGNLVAQTCHPEVLAEESGSEAVSLKNFPDSLTLCCAVFGIVLWSSA